MGLYGMGIDNLLSVNLVNAAGVLGTVNTTSDPDLWFALRGAGANFGIVTSLKIRAYPAASDDIWTGNLMFPASKLRSVVQVLNDLDFLPGMSSMLVFAAVPSPADPSHFEPTIIVSPTYSMPSIPAARAAFAPLLALSPLIDTTATTPYKTVNADQDPFCAKGGRKPIWGVALKYFDPGTVEKVWEEYTAFLEKNPGTEQSAMIWEYFPGKETSKGNGAVDAGAYPHRDIAHDVIINPIYRNASLDAAAEMWSRRVRSLLVQSPGSGDQQLRV